MPAETETQVLQLSELSKEEIKQALQKIIEESIFHRFTIIMKRTIKSKGSEFLPSPFKGKRNNSQYSMNISTYKHDTDTLNVFDVGRSKFSNVASERLVLEYQEEKPISKGIRMYAEGYFEESLEVLHQIEAEYLKSNALSNTIKEFQDANFYIGNCYYRLREYERAIEYYKKSFIDEDAKQVGQKLHNLGSCYAVLKQHRLSLKAYGEALKIYSECPQIDCSNLLNNLGTIYLKSGMYETAETYFSQSINERKLKSPENSFMLFYSYKEMGICQKLFKKYPEAASSLLFALNFAERGFGNLADTLKELASLYQLMEKWTEALGYYQKLSDYNEKNDINQGFIYESVSRIHLKLGHNAEYAKFLKMAETEYRKINNERKLSELSKALQMIKPK